MRDQLHHPTPDPPAGWRRSAQVPVIGVLLALVEWGLVRLVGAPVAHLEVLRHLGDPGAEPLASVLAVLALAAEGLVAYLLLVLVLRSLSTLPGAIGRLAARSTRLVAPVAVRRALDLLLGGALLVHTTLALAPPARSSPPTHRLQAATAALPAGVAAAAGASLVGEAPSCSHLPSPGSMLADGTEPVETRPAPRRSSAPLPPWLSGGPSNPVPDRAPATGGHAADGTGTATADAGTGAGTHAPRTPGRHTVVPDDTLWGIAATHLQQPVRSASNIHRYWQRIYRANRPVIGPDPDLIHPGTRLVVPPYHPDRR